MPRRPRKSKPWGYAPGRPFRRHAGGYAYDVYAAVSEDAGRSWSEPFLLHNDGTDTEHGFVTLFPSGLCNGASDNYSICYRGVHQDGEIEPLHELATPDTVARMSIPQLAKIDDHLLFVWTGKNDDQYQISWCSVLTSSIFATDQIAASR